MSDDYFLLGVDAGATNCRVVIADPYGNILARASGGPANIANNYNEAKSNILSTTNQALQSLGKSETHYGELRAVLGVAGNNLGDFGAVLHRDLPFENEVMNDGAITLAGALRERLGVMAVLGTGSVFVGQSEDGFKTVGGWGFMMGDEGSGGKMGFHLFERTIYAEDGIVEHSDLTRAILGEFHGSLGHLVEAAKSMDPHEFGEYAPRILDAEARGDANAKAIIEDHVKMVEAQIDAVGFRADRAFCALGGLGPIFLPKLAQKYQDAYVEPYGNALDGAVYLAREKWGKPA